MSISLDLDVPSDVGLLAHGPSPVNRYRQRKDANATSTNLIAAVVALMGSALLLALMASLIQPTLGYSHTEEAISEAVQHNEGYGVDTSWPIFGPLKKDDSNRIFGEGTRHEAYMKHLQGCRSHYMKQSREAAQTCDTYEFDRLLMNQRQPISMEVSSSKAADLCSNCIAIFPSHCTIFTCLQNYTDVGFKKIQAPPRVAQLVRTFWEQNKDKQRVPEIWPVGNVYTNHWDSPTTMLSVDDTGLRGSGYAFKKSIWDAARSTISTWTGGQDITPVSMYGIRVYHNNSLLVPHVDRLPLVASAMVNVAQDVEEDWPMEIYDHSGRAHNVTLRPGEMLLFESHSVLHGRPFPLKGKFYAMLFMHFEPTMQTPLRQKESIDEQYRQAVQDGVGGQSSSEQASMLPPYIRRFSPEEEHWQKDHPEGWRSPVDSTATAAGQNPVNTNNSTNKAQNQSKSHQAAREGDFEFWLNALAQATLSKARYELVNGRDNRGWQPIHESAVHGKLDVVELLLKHGAEINTRTQGGRGGTPLFLARDKLGAEHKVVKYLTSKGALSIPPDRMRDEL